jgi:glucose/arabinose dehydrogenase/cytochrome c2
MTRYCRHMTAFILACAVLVALSSVLTSRRSSAEVSATESTDSRFWVEDVASGLNHPWSMAWLPDGDMLITERNGGLRLLHNGKLDSTLIAGVPPAFQNIFNGLHDIQLDPDYSKNHLVYLSFSEGTFDEHRATVLRARFDGKSLLDGKIIFRSNLPIGGIAQVVSRMVFLPDKTLLIGVPDDHFHRHMAQRLDVDLGKIVRVNRDGSIPPDNPYVAQAGARPEIFSLGHRAILGLYRDPVDGLLWEVEAGPMGGDEINLIKRGANYGWPLASWGFDYSGALISDKRDLPGMESPIAVWSPSVTPSGIARYRGKVFPQWQGDFFVGNLTVKLLRRLRIEDGKVVLQESLLSDLNERIRDVKVGPDGLLYVLTDNDNGRLLRLRPGRPHGTQTIREARRFQVSGVLPSGLGPDGPVVAEFTPGDPVKGRQYFLERCSGCHSVGNDIAGGAIGPDLAGVFGRVSGSLPKFSFSGVMGNHATRWDHITMNLFIANPSGYFPGTSMSATPVTDPQQRRDIIGYLRSQRTP